MKIVVANTSDIEGGAARCANRLHKGLLSAGVKSTYFVQKKYGSGEQVLTPRFRFNRLLQKYRARIDRLPIQVYPLRRRTPFSTGFLSYFNANEINNLNSDLVNLHYIAEGFIPIKSLENISTPIVWSFHDSWPFTGGCHLPGDCLGYEQACGRCPALGSSSQHDLSNLLHREKAIRWSHLNITVTTDSNWLADCVRKSSLFRDHRIEVIHPGLCLKTFAPVDKTSARTILSLPLNKNLVLFGAINSVSDPNKGFQFLLPAIKNFSSKRLQLDSEVVIFGSERPDKVPDFGIPARYYGRLDADDRLALLYSAADVMVVPSIRESFGQTASEALACGTPVVAFRSTGLLDIINHMQNGFLAEAYKPESLANGIEWVLGQNLAARRLISHNSRESAVNRFGIKSMTDKYIQLFRDVIRM